MPLKDLRKYWREKQAVIASDCSTNLNDVESQRTKKDAALETDDNLIRIPISTPSVIVSTVTPSKCSLPIFRVWPSQDSLRNECDGQSFIFNSDDCYSPSMQHDSGIDSVQASPSPMSMQMNQQHEEKLDDRERSASITTTMTTATSTPTPTTTPLHSPKYRRKSSAFLHPDHARLLRTCAPSPEASAEEDSEYQNSCSGSASSSTASSLSSVAAAVAAIGVRHSDPWQKDRRRSSTMTARYSLLDALDLEYALIRAAARGSVGPYSLSESLHKLTFTQSLAFPALARARGLTGKRTNSFLRAPPLDPADSGLNAFAKIVTVLVLMFVSLMVFAVVYKFVRT